MPEVADVKGLIDLGGGVHAYVSGSTDFGLSNAGLVVSAGEALVVDTLYDVAHAREMLGAIGPATSAAPVRYVFNTHSDGDHIFGNQVFADDVEIIASAAAAALMTQDQADLTAAAFDASADPASPLHPLSALARPFDFHPVRVRGADTTFQSEKHLRVGSVDVELYELGPAHTVGDAIAYLPEQRVLFAGDLLTRDIVKVVWSGSVANWIAALRRIRSLPADIVVTGHGPVLSGADIRTAIDTGIGFWSTLHDQAAVLFDRGVPVDEAARRIDIGEHPDAALTLPTLVAAVYHGLDPAVPYKTVPETLQFMAAQLGGLDGVGDPAIG